MTLSVRLEASGIKPAPEMLGAPSPITYGSSPEMLLAILHQSERCLTEIHVGCFGGIFKALLVFVSLAPISSAEVFGCSRMTEEILESGRIIKDKKHES